MISPQNQLLKLHQANSQPVIGILSIDNYADAIDKLDDKDFLFELFRHYTCF